ncbi:protein FAR-RED ELONGATED HYPOCOTYL 3-like [Chenopodium quinoa]|uniref:protein FAR-RED ELONGATED HYPOCOTYL 3-like n=1 Tax=Chenopodium quinoa TaxID=63459 RepID=UPI000B77AE89|nr:protein FAR-RED ELONGATED HYPOCOTYL 3-like [Chenopodium quinoa]
MWIPAYVKDVFWAGMQTTQRVESINNFFVGYLNKHTRLSEFAPCYCKAMESRANDEREADANAFQYVRPLATKFSIERKFQKLYTDAKFLKVQNQCTRLRYLTCESRKILFESEVEYVFMDHVWIYSKFLKREIPLKEKSKQYVVVHIIKVLDVNDVTEVPFMYILDRWRKDIKRNHTLVKVAYHDPSKTEDVIRYDKMMVGLEPMVMRASASDQAVEILMDMI